MDPIVVVVVAEVLLTFLPPFKINHLARLLTTWLPHLVLPIILRLHIILPQPHPPVIDHRPTLPHQVIEIIVQRLERQVIITTHQILTIPRGLIILVQDLRKITRRCGQNGMIFL